MAAEYNGRMDADKTVFIWPRPLTRTQDRIRALNLTGDASGSMPTDNQAFWQGEDWRKILVEVAQVNAHLALEDAIAAAWY